MTEKLKSCPYCKKEVANITNCIELEDCANFEECGNSGWVCVVCNANKGGCGATGGYADSEEKAILKWNTRAADENPPLTLDELRQMQGEPVWVESKGFTGWAIILKVIGFTTDYVQADGKVKFRHANGYRKTWIAYKRKPEEAKI